MQLGEPEVSLQYAALYRASMGQAVLGAPDLMARLVAHNRATLRAQEEQAEDGRERDRLQNARRLLNQFESVLCARFTEELTSAFTRMAMAERARPGADLALHFDQIAAMDERQVRRSVEQARARLGLDAATVLDPALAALHAALCAHMGLPLIVLQPHPLRTVLFVETVAIAVSQLPVPPMVRQGWITCMGGALGQTLNGWYQDMAQALRDKAAGTMPVLPATMATFSNPPLRPPLRPPAQLTLERLRKLLVDAGPRDGVSLAERFDLPAADAMAGAPASAVTAEVPPAYQATVPAALEALQEAGKVELVVQRIMQRRAEEPSGADAAEALRAQAREAAQALEHSLGVEVVALMVDNIVRDPRLLAPIHALVAELEPALLQLARHDPRFFSDRQHPARRLLHEITHRSIAFESVDSRGFSGFMEPLREAVAPLVHVRLEDTAALPFDAALSRLTQLLDDHDAREKRQVARAVRALRKAQQRNALAATLAMDVLARPEAALVPDAILDFLCGPWAQVVAHARMNDRSGDADPDHYIGLVDDLLWSAQPHLTRHKVSALTRLVPKLLAQLRLGLATIDYPAQQTSQFFEVLMQLHQRGFKPEPDGDLPAVRQSRESLERRQTQLGRESAWIAPAEARASGFIDIETPPAVVPGQVPMDGLKPGAWVALFAEGGWTRTRLSWVSENGALLLFVDALGYLQSLTRSACESLLLAGNLRLIADDPVEDALDAVARTAMRNSVDVRL
jgi:hypothetical protein